MEHIEFASETEFIEVDVVNCENEKCYTEITNLRKELEDHQQKIEHLSQQYHDLLIENLKRDGIIRKLKMALRKQNNLCEFKDVLSEAFDELSSMENEPGKDSTFINKLMRHVYKDDLSGLKNKTYSNKGSGKTKQALTPRRLNLIRDIFKKRVAGNGDRMAMFGKHIKTGLESIARQLEPTCNEPINENK